jgi:hypothetical protein
MKLIFIKQEDTESKDIESMILTVIDYIRENYKVELYFKNSDNLLYISSESDWQTKYKTDYICYGFNDDFEWRANDIKFELATHKLIFKSLGYRFESFEYWTEIREFNMDDVYKIYVGKEWSN